MKKFKLGFLLIFSADPSIANSGEVNYGVNGSKVASALGFRFLPTATLHRIRSHLFYNSNTSNRQYFC